ncbi:MAG: GNAT family N-acetyltransferase [Actinomycetes bacterium]
MSTRQTLTLGNERFYVGPWHADSAIAYLTIKSNQVEPTARGLHACLDQLRQDGYSSVITTALHPLEARPYFDAGFLEYDRLRVLSHDLRRVGMMGNSKPAGVQLRRAKRADRSLALAVDKLAFPRFWRLDASGLDEAISATPRTRFRLAELQGAPVGYSVVGKSRHQGFLQRLATHPDYAGTGVGSALVVDALLWARSRKVSRVLVNTQTDNQRALRLYKQLGFQLTPTDLVVLTKDLP